MKRQRPTLGRAKPNLANLTKTLSLSVGEKQLEKARIVASGLADINARLELFDRGDEGGEPQESHGTENVGWTEILLVAGVLVGGMADGPFPVGEVVGGAIGAAVGAAIDAAADDGRGGTDDDSDSNDDSGSNGGDTGDGGGDTGDTGGD